jgi:hypothetical protein
MPAPTEAQMNALYAIANEERPDGRVSIPLAVAALLTWASELEHRAKLGPAAPAVAVQQLREERRTR